MSYCVQDWELKVDGESRKKVLKKFKLDDDWDCYESLENGYHPGVDEKEMVMFAAKRCPGSDIFFWISGDYGEFAYEFKDGKFKELKKNWE